MAHPRSLPTLALLLCSATAAASVPSTPSNSAPGAGWDTDNTPTLTGSVYSDPEGNPHLGTQFQVRTAAGTYGGAGSRDSAVLGPTRFWSVSPSLPSGTYFFQVRYSDAEGFSGYSAETQLNIDSTNPSTPGTPVLSGTETSGVFSATWTASTDAHSGLQQYPLSARQGALFPSLGTPNTNSATLTLGPGTYELRVRAEDNVGNLSSHSGYSPLFTVVPDGAVASPASVSLSTAVTNDTYTVSWTAVPGAVKYLISRSLDQGATWRHDRVVNAPGLSYSTDPDSIGLYRYRVAVALSDRVGDWSGSSPDLLYDDDDPDSPDDLAVTPALSTGPAFSLTWSEVEDDLGNGPALASGVDYYLLERAPEGSSSWTSSPRLYTPATSTTDLPADGRWQYRLLAVDRATNSSDSSPTIRVVRDTTAPGAPGRPVASPTVTRFPVALSWPAAADSTSGIATYAVERGLAGAGSWTLIQGGVVSTATSDPVGEGVYEYRVIATDAAGWVGPPSSVSLQVIVDQTPPVPPDAPSVSQAPGSSVVTVGWNTVTDSGGAGLASYRLERSPDGAAWGVVGTAGSGETQFQDALPIEGWRYRVIAIDGAGNESASPGSSQAEFGPPQIVEDAHGLSAVGVGYAYNAAGRVGVVGAGPLAFRRCGGPPQFLVESRTGAVSWVPVASGQSSLCVEVTNAFGSDSYSFVVDTLAAPPAGGPVARIAGTFDGPASLQLSLDGSASTSGDGSPLHAWRWREGTFGPLRTGAVVTAQYVLPGGYRSSLQVVDETGQVGVAEAPIAALDALGNRPPSARILASSDRGEGTLQTQLTCDCAAGSTPIRGYRWRLSTGEVFETPTVELTLPAGRHHALLEVVDAAGLSAFSKFELVVTSSGREPPHCEVVADPPAAIAPAAVRYSVELWPGSEEVDTVSLTTTEGEVDAATVVRQHPLAGSFETSARVVDVTGLSCADVGLVRIADDRSSLPPRFLSNAGRAATCGVDYVYGAAPAVAGTGPFGYRLEGDVPEGATVDPATGVLAWTPTSLHAGLHEFLLRVDGPAGSATQTVEVEVACGGQDLQVACGCSSVNAPSFLVGLLLVGFGRWRRRRSRLR